MIGVVTLLFTGKSPTEAAIAITFGIAFVAIAFVNRNFYWLKGWGSGDKPAPRWVGRMLFGIGGLLCIAIGIRDLWFRS